MSNWPFATDAIQEVLGQGTGTGTNVTCGTTDTKGAYATIGTSTVAYEGFWVFTDGIGASRPMVFDVAVGATPNIIVQDAFSMCVNSQDHRVLYFPVRIPAATDVKMRAQTNNPSNTITAIIVGHKGGFGSPKGYSKAVQLATLSGSLPTNSVTLTGTTFSAWGEVIASTPQNFAGLIGIETVRGATGGHLITEVAVGAAAAEQKIMTLFSNSNSNYNPGQATMPMRVPAGSRLSFRGQASGANTNTLSLSIMGLVG